MIKKLIYIVWVFMLVSGMEKETWARHVRVRPDPGLKARASVTIKIILGSQKPGFFPKELERLKRQLTRPPFSAFKSFKMLKTLSFQLVTPRPVTAVLTGPYVLTVSLIKTSRSRKGVIRYHFGLKLIARREKRDRTLHSSKMILARDGTFFLAGPKHQSGTLILGITFR